MGLDCVWGFFLEEVTCRAGPGKVLVGEEVTLRKRFGLVLVPGVGQASSGGLPRGPRGREGGAVTQVKLFLVPKEPWVGYVGVLHPWY